MYRSAQLTLLAFAATLAIATAAEAKRSADTELLIVTTASNRGEVDPCG